MKKIKCHSCNASDIPMNKSLKINYEDYCTDCIDRVFPDEASLEGKEIINELDPTVCAKCDNDFGETNLPLVAQYPICTDCKKELRNKTFPTWVKAFLVGIAAIVIFSIFWNWKYYQGYANLQLANEYAAKGNYTKGAALMQTASEQVSEVEELKTLSYFYKGVGYMQTDQAEKAMTMLKKCQGKLPDDYNLSTLMLNAEVGITFDKKDYDGFLKANLAQFEKDSTVVEYCQGVASAYSCLYATKGNETDKTKAMDYLARAHKMDSTSTESKFYRNMIEYRLINRKMITREEFKKQFPYGWTKP